MEQQPGREERPSYPTVFEGAEQETVEILPDIERLTPAEREQGVVARLGRTRVERRVAEGPAPLSNAVAAGGPGTDDALVDVTYRLAGYYTIAIAGLLLTVAIAWVMVLWVGK